MTPVDVLVKAEEGDLPKIRARPCTDSDQGFVSTQSIKKDGKTNYR